MKTVINLVKELGVKSTAEVLELLRQVGVDTEAEGFGVMSKVDDQTVIKLQQLRNGGGGQEPAPKKLPAASKRRLVDDSRSLNISTGGLHKTAGKDFFGTREPAAADPGVRKPGPKAVPPPAKPRPKAAPGRAEAGQKKGERPDLSSGPRIISMPDPNEVKRLKQERESPRPVETTVDNESGQKQDGGRAGKSRKTAKADFGGGRRRKLKEIGVVEEEGRIRSRKRVFKVAGKSAEPSQTVVPHIKITREMTIREVARETGVKVSEIVRFLMRDLGIMASINHQATVDEIQLIADNFNIKYTVNLEAEPEGELVHFEEIEEEKQVERPPVVTVMGHVDHGKTKLLDAIRATKVMEGEAGGITQHIGAYQVEKKGKRITFLDTPGHEAFTAMRARGSQVTDIVILVVAADDGVMPQTIEAIEHAKSANVPIIVAVNKIDKEDANPDRVKNQLSERGLVPEEWGGDTVFVHISALKGTNLDELLEMILLTTELVAPRADPMAPAFGVVVESKVDTGIGVVATVLVQQGTMSKGMFILSGTTVGRIKWMEDDLGSEVSEAGPAMPVKIIGFSDPPENGDKVYCFMNKKQAQAIADQRVADQRVKATSAGSASRMSLEAFFAKAEAGELKDLNLIVKADVQGSAEALSTALEKLEVQGASCSVISSGVGQINETDVNLAAAAGAVIIGFSAGMSGAAKLLAEREHVDVRLYDIIYKVTEDVEAAMKGLLEPVYEDRDIGRAEVRAIFKTGRDGVVAGGYVLDGVARRGAKYRLKRDGEIIHRDATLNSLKRFKDDTREVASGFECGFMLHIPGLTIEEGDILEFYETVEAKRE